jgi:hypothetical protein
MFFSHTAASRVGSRSPESLFCLPRARTCVPPILLAGRAWLIFVAILLCKYEIFLLINKVRLACAASLSGV